MLQQGKARTRPPKGKAQAHAGVHPLTPYSDIHFEPLPNPLGLPPYHFDLEIVLPGISHRR
jgi:acid phosphatase type 7